MKRKVSICIGRFQKLYGEKGALDVAKEIGADGVDLTLCGHFESNKADNLYTKGADAVVEYFSEIKRHADAIGIEIAQTHGRITGFKNAKEEDDRLVEEAKLDILATKALGATHCVMHTTTTIFMDQSTPRSLMHKLNYDMYTRILPFAKEHGIIIDTETFGDATGKGCVDFFGDIREFIMGYNKVACTPGFADNFKICVDPGHSNKATRFGNPSAPDVIRLLGKNITTLHLNDNDTLTDQHKTPGTGCIDWKDLFDALDEVGYDGWYNMELDLNHFGMGFEKEEAAFSIKVMRQMLKTRYGEDA